MPYIGEENRHQHESPPAISGAIGVVEHAAQRSARLHVEAVKGLVEDAKNSDKAMYSIIACLVVLLVILTMMVMS